MLQDTVAVTKHMKFKFENVDREVPDLEFFKEQLICQMLRSTFFQNEPKDDLDMLNFPNIIAPKLLKQQINTDCDKKTLFYQEETFESENMVELTKLVYKKKIDIVNLDCLKTNEIKKLAQNLRLKSIAAKSSVRLLEEIKCLCKMFAAGQGIQFKYTYIMI